MSEHPLDWSVQALRAVAERVRRNSKNQSLDVLTISSTEGWVDQRKKWARNMAGKSIENYTLLRRGEFSYNRGNSKTYPQGCVFRLDRWGQGLVPSVYHSFRITDPNIHSQFLAHFFLAGGLNEQLRRVITSSARDNGLVNITADEFFSSEIPIPPLAEQRKIAEILSSVDEVIENTESEIKKLEDFKKATLNELLTKGIGHTEFKDSEIGRIPKSWKFDRFGNHMAVRGGYAFRTMEFVAGRNEGLPLVRMSNLKAGICDLSDSVYVARSALHGRDQFELHEGDFVFGMSGSIGTHARIKKHNLPCYLNQRVGRLVPKSKCPRFFEVVFLSHNFQAELKAMSAGGAQANISPTQIEDISIAVPTPSEQELIAGLDAALSKAINSKSKFLEKIRAIKTGLSHDLLTGKVRVKVN